MAVQMSQKIFDKKDIKKVLHENWGLSIPVLNFKSLEIEDDFIVFINEDGRVPLFRGHVTIKFMPHVKVMDIKAIQRA